MRSTLHPGRVLFPKLQELALAYKDVTFIKVDVDELEVRLACVCSAVAWKCWTSIT